jgi:hypothetical protein
VETRKPLSDLSEFQTAEDRAGPLVPGERLTAPAVVPPSRPAQNARRTHRLPRQPKVATMGVLPWPLSRARGPVLLRSSKIVSVRLLFRLPAGTCGHKGRSTAGKGAGLPTIDLLSWDHGQTEATRKFGRSFGRTGNESWQCSCRSKADNRSDIFVDDGGSLLQARFRRPSLTCGVT